MARPGRCRPSDRDGEEAGLDEGEALSFLFENFDSVTDDEALEAFKLCCRTEGIIPALEPSHALAHVAKIAPQMEKNKIIIMNLCGRGDKDVFTVAEALGVKI